MCLKELMLTKPLLRASASFVISGTFLKQILDFIKKYVMVVMI